MKASGLRFLYAVLLSVGPCLEARAEPLQDSLHAEIARCRKILDGLPKSEFVDSDRARLQGLLNDADDLLRSGRIRVAVETMASAIPGIAGMSRASTGWDDTGKAGGKTIDTLSKEWEESGRAIKARRERFPVAKPAGQGAFLRATAEQSLGQVDEHYAVAVEYGRTSGVTSGAYYLGRAEGQLDFALYLSGLTTTTEKPESPPPDLGPALARLEDEIVSAYAKPGSTAQHTNFIIANSSLKLAKELNQKGWRRGALLTLMRSYFALNLATLGTPAAEQDSSIAIRTAEMQKALEESKRDDTIALAYLEKAGLSIEKSKLGGEGADRERLRAQAIVSAVLPRYLEILKGVSP